MQPSTTTTPLCHLHLPQCPGGARSVPVMAGHSLLEAALAAGVPMDSSCRNGTCRACLSQLASGTVAYRVEWPGLLPEEKAAGAVLPCVAIPASAAATPGTAPRDNALNPPDITLHGVPFLAP